MVQGRIYDVSLAIYSGMLVWPGNPPVKLEDVRAIAKGGSSNISRLSLGSHTATHIDAPRHFIDGAAGVDAIDNNVLLGPARLFCLPDVNRIDRRLLEGLDLDGVSRLLLSSGNSIRLRKQEFDRGYGYLTEDGAEYLVGRNIKLVGVDYLSIEEYKNPGNPVHKILLAAAIVIVEGLDLEGVPPGNYELICLPLKIKNGDGAPARVLLKEFK